MIGFVNIIKPKGMTSAAAVAKVRRKLNVDCGHMGTLDPMAEGVLPIALGKTCRLFGYLLDKEKEYKAVFSFGRETDTLDATGKTISETDKIPTEEEIKNVLHNFVGEIMQVPPKYSAKCVDGVKSYKLARRGKDFELQAKKVTVISLELLSFNEGVMQLGIKCKGGTYVRSLGRDIAYAVGSLATMESLIRVKSGIFELKNGIDVSEFEKCENPEKYIINSDAPLTFEKITLDRENTKRLIDGLPRRCDRPEGLYSVYSPSGFLCIGEVKEGLLKGKTYVGN